MKVIKPSESDGSISSYYLEKHKRLLPQFPFEEVSKQPPMTLDLDALEVHIADIEKPTVPTQCHHHQKIALPSRNQLASGDFCPL